MQNDIKKVYDSVYTRDSIKVIDIVDAFGKLRYKVSLLSYDIYNDIYGVIYSVQVTNCFTAPDPLIIVTIPEEGKPPLTDYNIALKIFNECVENYTSLVKAETRDFQDIDVFKTRIDYKVTCPECCETCKFSQHNKHPRNFVFAVDNGLKCVNPKVATEYDFDMPKGLPHTDCHNKYANHHLDKLIVNPRVEPFGLCKHYEKRNSPHPVAPYERIIDVVDYHVSEVIKHYINKYQDENNSLAIQEVNKYRELYNTSQMTSDELLLKLSELSYKLAEKENN